MFLIIVVTTLIGLWFCRTRAWFKWVTILFAWFLAATLLLSAYGSLDDPSGNGLVTRQIRRAAGDGPAVGLYAIVFLVFHIGFTLYGLSRLWDAWRDHRAAPPEAEEGSDLLPDLTGRKQLETLGVLALAGLWLAASWPSGGVPRAEVAAAGEVEAAALAAEAGAPLPGPAAGPTTVEEALEIAAAEVNKDVPQTMDEATTLVRVAAAGRTLTYHYDLRTPHPLRKDLASFIRREVVPKACRGLNREVMRDEGVVYTYSYTSKTMDEPLLETMDEKRCAALDR